MISLETRKKTKDSLIDIVEVFGKIGDREDEKPTMLAVGWALRNLFRIAKSMNLNLNKSVSYGCELRKEGDMIRMIVTDNKGGLKQLQEATKGQRYNWHNLTMIAEAIEYIRVAGIFCNDAIPLVDRLDLEGMEVLLGRAAWNLEMVLTLFRRNIQEAVSNKINKPEVEAAILGLSDER